MAVAQLTELMREGHTIGAHSITHRILTTLEAVDIFWEVRGSKEQLETQLHTSIDVFCYPSGAYNTLVKKAVKSSGYLGACSVEPGANTVGVDPYALKRTEISGFDTLWDFEKKLAGAYDWLHRAVQGMR